MTHSGHGAAADTRKRKRQSAADELARAELRQTNTKRQRHTRLQPPTSPPSDAVSLPLRLAGPSEKKSNAQGSGMSMANAILISDDEDEDDEVQLVASTVPATNELAMVIDDSGK